LRVEARLTLGDRATAEREARVLIDAEPTSRYATRLRSLLGWCRYLCRHLCAWAQLRLPARLPPPNHSPTRPMGIGPPSDPRRHALRHSPHSLAPQSMEQRAGSQRPDPPLGRLDPRRRQSAAHRGACPGHRVHRTHLPPRRNSLTLSHSRRSWDDRLSSLVTRAREVHRTPAAEPANGAPGWGCATPTSSNPPPLLGCLSEIPDDEAGSRRLQRASCDGSS